MMRLLKSNVQTERYCCQLTLLTQSRVDLRGLYLKKFAFAINWSLSRDVVCCNLPLEGSSTNFFESPTYCVKHMPDSLLKTLKYSQQSKQISYI